MTEALVQARPLAAPPRVQPLAEVVELLPPVPRLRGVSHEKAFAFSPALGVLLVASADGPLAVAAAVVFAVTMIAMLGASALNHRAVRAPHWDPWLRRLDHTTINLFLAGTWTSVALVLLSGTTRIAVAALVWAGALAASSVTVLWVRVPGWIPATAACALGWSAAIPLGELVHSVGAAAVSLFVLGGLVYTLGAVVYALRRPRLHSDFGYHELFHALVLVGVACHYAALALLV